MLDSFYMLRIINSCHVSLNKAISLFVESSVTDQVMIHLNHN